MRIGISQILVLLIIIFLLFGDFETLKKKFKNLVKQTIKLANKNNKNKI